MTTPDIKTLSATDRNLQLESGIADKAAPRTRADDGLSSRCEDPAVFGARFWRCYRLLHFIASRIFGNGDRTEDAIANCLLKASHNPPSFVYEGAFRSWLVRILIDEAILILRQDREAQI